MTETPARVNEVPAIRGARWLGEAFGLFRRAPLAWISLCVGWIVIWFGLMLIPYLGPVIANLLQPVFFGSFAIAAFRQSAGERIGMGDLFAAFRRNLRALVNIGLLLMLAQVASAFMMQWMGMPAWPQDQPFDIVAYAEMLESSVWIIASGLAFMAVASGFLWFAPQLIVFHGMPASHAIRWSVYAALSNLGAMLVYGTLLMAAMLAAWIPLGLGLLVMVPVLAISTYTGYRDVFEGGLPPATSE